MIDLAVITTIIRYAVIFIFGTCAGSFVACTVDRMETKRDWIRGRSECDSCKHILRPLDLVPVLSWLILGGRCRYCKKPIGVLSLLMELLMGGLFVGSVFALASVLEVTPEQLLTCYNDTKSLLLVIWFVIITLFAILTVYDTKYHILPNAIMYPLIVFSFIYLLVGNLLGGFPNNGQWLLESIFAFLPLAGLYGVIWFTSKGKLIGFGDVKLCIALSLLLGSWQLTVMTLFLANAICSFAALPKIIGKKLRLNSHIAFGPCLIIAAVIAMFAGGYINQLLMQLFWL